MLCFAKILFYLKFLSEFILIKFSTLGLVKIDYYETQRGARGILYNGHHFIKEKAFGKTINW